MTPAGGAVIQVRRNGKKKKRNNDEDKTVKRFRKWNGYGRMILEGNGEEAALKQRRVTG
jgi:hypothetical protein